MTLFDLVRQMDSLSHEETLYVEKPWHPWSEARLITDSDKSKEDGKDYFLEVFMAKDFLDTWKAALPGEPSIEEACDRLILYAAERA